MSKKYKSPTKAGWGRFLALNSKQWETLAMTMLGVATAGWVLLAQPSLTLFASDMSFAKFTAAQWQMLVLASSLWLLVFALASKMLKNVK